MSESSVSPNCGSQNEVAEVPAVERARFSTDGAQAQEVLMINFDGATIRRLRRQAGVTQEELARALGVSFATVNRWENGHTHPSPAAQKLLQAFFQQNVPQATEDLKLDNTDHSVRVLIVDDDPSVRRALRRTLARLGSRYEVETADDGYEAGVKTATFRPHIVVLDLFLPRLDGIRVCRFLKENPETQSVKVIAVTGYGTDETLRQVREAGADVVMLKPIDMVEFLQKVEQLSPAGRGASSRSSGSALALVRRDEVRA
ncbi:MAG: response regulator [Calditrichaeota bacterium]|nr:response regulator [Calditrichota bacterium]